ncbi:ATP-binding protein [Bordetella tumulicola]|uniref:ATP-binding protein n=1 Tax=Bordetella tumulicola TaxID=1649133 RepID=UPI0039EE4E10
MLQQTDTLDLSPGVHAVRSATRWLASISDRERWSAALAFALTLCVDEALTNVVSYAFSPLDAMTAGRRSGDQAPPSIHLRCTLLAQQVRIEIIDNGRSYDVTRTAPLSLAQSLDEARIGGLGLHLMRHYLSDMSYRRHENKNHLTLIINTHDGAT